MFESIIRNRVIRLRQYDLLNDSLHGFTAKRSCLTNSLVFLEEVTDYIDKGKPINVLYLDFQKAFDKVPHERLLRKLEALGIGRNLLRPT